MAVKADAEFIVPIKADGKALKKDLAKIAGEVKNIAPLEKAIKSLSGQIEAMSKAFEMAEKTEFAKVAQQNTQLLKTMEKQVNVTSKALDNQSGSLTTVSLQAHKASKAYGELEGNISGIAETVQTIGQAVSGSVQAFNNLINILELLSDSDRIRKLSDLLKVLGAILMMRGQRQFANQLFEASDQLGIFAEKLDDLKGMSLEDMANKADFLRNVMGGLKDAMTGVTVAAAGFVGLGLVRTFQEIGPNLDKTNVSLREYNQHFKRVAQSPAVIKKGFAAGFGSAAKDVQRFGTTANSAGIAVVKSLTPGLVTATEAGIVLGPVLFALGRTMATSENDAIRFAGILSTTVSIALLGFSAAITLAVVSIGNLIVAIGDGLIGAMTKWEEKASKANAITNQFAFVLAGFARVAGETAVGSLAVWNEQIDMIASNSTLAVTSLQKAVKIIIAEGQALHLSLAENQTILERSADLAAANGIEVEDAALRIAKALGGSADSLMALGIMVNDSALEHSKFVQEQGIVISQLSLHEKAQLRLNEIIRQTAPIVGAAANELVSIAGANEKYEQAVTSLQIELGKQGAFTIWYTNTLTRLLTTLVELPQPIKDVVGASTDFLGVTLKILGTLIKYAITISTVITAMGFLSGVIAKNIVFQNILTGAFSFVASSVGANTIAVTSLNAAYLNLVAIVKGSVIVLFKMLGQVMLAVAARTAMVTKAILTNPLFYKALIIAGGIAAIVKAFKELREEFKQFEKPVKVVGEQLEDQVDIWGEIVKIAEKVTRAVVQVAKLSIIGLFEIVEMLKIAVLGWRKMWATITDNEEALIQIQKEGDEALAKLGNLGRMGERALVGVLSSFEDTAIAAGDAGNQFDMLSGKMKTFSEQVRDLSVPSEFMAIQALGTEFEKASASFVEANKNYNLAIDALATADTMTKELRDKVSETGLDKEKQRLNLLNLRQQTLKAIADTENQTMQSLLTSSNRLIDAQKMENAERLKGFDQMVIGLAALAPLSKAQQDDIARTRDLLIQQNQAAIDAASAQQNAGALQAMEKLNDQTKEITDQLKTQNVDRLKAIKIVEEMRMKEIAGAEEALRLAGLLTDERQKQLEAARAAVGAKSEADVASATGQDKMPQLFDAGQISMITSTMGEAAGGIAAGASALAATPLAFIAVVDMILDAILAIIDIIPSILNKIADVFNNLTDLPGKIADAFLNIFDSIANFITNFIPNIINMIVDTLLNLVDFLADGLPKALESLPEKIMEGLFRLVEKLPEIAMKLAMAFIRLGPLMGIKIAIGLIKAIPELIRKLVEAIPEIAMALANGLIIAVKQMINDIASALGLGDIFNIDLGGVEEKMASLGEKIATSASQMFEVVDLEAASRGFDLADRIGNAIGGATNRAAGILQRIWEMLVGWVKKAWSWLVTFFENLGSLISKAWKAVMEFFENLGDLISRAWKQVMEWMEKLGGFIDAAWASTIRFFKEDIGGFIKGAWEFLVKLFTEDLPNLVKTAFAFVVDFFTETLPTLVKNAFAGLKEIGTKIWEGLKEGLEGAGKIFSKLGSTIWGGLKAGFDKIGNLFSKIFDTSGAFGDKGTVEKALNIDLPFMNFAGGGVVPGVAKVAGDSLRNDTVVSLVSPGEAIIPRSLMSNPLIANLVTSLLDGSLKGFGFGGVVGAIVSGDGGSAADQLTGGDSRRESTPDGGVLGAISKGDFKEAGRLLDPGNLGNAWSQVSQKVAEMVMKMFESNSFATGGTVGGAVPVLAHRGEEIINERSSRANRGLLKAINDSDGPIGLGGGGGITIQKLEINSTTPISRDSIRRDIVPELERQLRRKSQDGRRVLDPKGVK